MIGRAAVLVLVLILALQGLSLAQPSEEQISECHRAEAILGDLIVNHPRTEIREELLGWINNGRVKIFCDFNQTAMASVAMRLEEGQPIEIFLTMNPHFITQSRVRSPVNEAYYDRRFKETVVYHEYIHLKEHFTDVSRLDVPALTETADRAKHIWETEYRAIKAQWELAKELRTPFLLLDIYKATRANPGEKGFLEGFYQMMQKMAYPDLGKLLPYWKKFYEEKKAAIQ